MLRHLSLLLAAIVSFTLILPAVADEKPMTTAEIAAALTGNTVHGMWGETEYYSYFDSNGVTIYTTKQGADPGTWSAKNNQYCSIWAGTGEDCYNLLSDGDKIIWIVPASGDRHPSTLMQGKVEPTFQ
ncbi:MAG: hypothetical protein ACREEE_18535 [Dongiaceae bacterium]